MSVTELKLQTVSTSKSPLSETTGLKQHAYVESGNPAHATLDVLRQFEANIATLEDLNGRLQYMMTEIRGLIRK